ncbi:prevent-host-death protein [Streptomyces sp. NPDC006296]|uniref:prevent-host-death protein n=1 Tax=Streptomyces sp. NPDC006296 TaxID=3156746 RepID=UPI0033B27C89
MRWLREKFRRRGGASAGPRFTGTLAQMIDGRPVVISEAGEPVPKALPARASVRRQGRGSLRGCVRIPVGFDDPRGSIAEAFGMR